jgi:carbonic anhydrase
LEQDPIATLRSGNARFVDFVEAMPDGDATRAWLTEAKPYAVVLGCSDSRVPPEIVFDETIGRLFVIRVASSVAGNEQIGTIEYALSRWGCPLIVVLGHTQCGGVAAAMDKLPPGADPGWADADSVHLSSLLGHIRSHLGSSGAAMTDDPWLDAVRQNVRRTIEQLPVWSPPISRRIATGCLKVVGAIYHVETGRVEFLD